MIVVSKSDQDWEKFGAEFRELAMGARAKCSRSAKLPIVSNHDEMRNYYLQNRTQKG
jgi:hypothetical protein